MRVSISNATTTESDVDMSVAAIARITRAAAAPTSHQDGPPAGTRTPPTRRA
jgi:hypothetical protein